MCLDSVLNHDSIRRGSFVISHQEAPLTVACEHDSWTAVLGNLKLSCRLWKMRHVSNCMLLPYYFVSDPSPRGCLFARHSSSGPVITFSCTTIVYYSIWIKNDLPSPGGCYFEPSEKISSQVLVLASCLSNEPMQQVLSVASGMERASRCYDPSISLKKTIAL
ncbi:hypothetical protein TNIN_418331 [Trichonephila inaurata madagascariensis]|uniref:Uncharacterized protein n=1 Tax=Trichonephila inaurata madagascariensis TaxID=2747483 RepID=A0A8X6JIG4_9ARAC|nr:hypothetical protein TNIN_418331 [Trichonephila inaurata madagascariensis]